MQPEIDLSGLKDLHLISPSPLWPLATGWWMLLGFFTLAIILGFFTYHRWRQRPAVYAMRKLKKITQDEVNDLTYLKKLSQLLRRVAIAADGRPRTAQLSDKTWQQFLIKRVPNAFSAKEAHLIAYAPYDFQMKSTVNRRALQEHANIWIKKILKSKNFS